MTKPARKRRAARARAHQATTRDRSVRTAAAEEFLDSLTVDQLREQVTAMVGPLSDADVVAVAATSVVHQVWRNTVVEWAHGGDGLGRISDGEMFSANVTLTRLVQGLLDLGGTDWMAVYDALTGPGLRLASRSTADLLGDAYDEWLDGLDRALGSLDALQDRLGPDLLVWLHTMQGVSTCWWGTPWWPDCVAAFVDEAEDTPDLAELAADAARWAPALIDAPDQLSPQELEAFVTAGLGYAAPKGRMRWVEKNREG